MSTISTGRNSGDGQTPHEVDAQKANQRDSDRGLAGVEAKPFAEPESGRHPGPDDAGTDAENAADQSPESLISARRNAGRD